MPEVIWMSRDTVVVECEYVPVLKKPDTEAELMQQVSEKVCHYDSGPKKGQIRCGYLREAAEKGLRISCMNKNSPYLAELKKRLEDYK